MRPLTTYGQVLGGLLGGIVQPGSGVERADGGAEIWGNGQGMDSGCAGGVRDGEILRWESHGFTLRLCSIVIEKKAVCCTSVVPEGI